MVDFGFLIDGSGKFVPALLGALPHNFRGYVSAGEEVRYGVELIADNFASRKLHYFDVRWDGKWSDDDDEMRLHLTVARP